MTTDPKLDIHEPFLFTDDLGPAKIVNFNELSTGLRATIVIVIF